MSQKIENVIIKFDYVSVFLDDDIYILLVLSQSPNILKELNAFVKAFLSLM